MRALWIVLSAVCSLTTAHRLGVERKGQILPDPHIASTPVASIAQQSPTNASKATSAPNAPNAPNATTKLFIANSSAHVNTSSSPLSIAKAAMLNATAAEEKLSLRRLRRLAVKVLAVLDGRRAEHIEPIEYVGTIAVVALGFGGAVWTIYAFASTTSAGSDHPRRLTRERPSSGRFDKKQYGAIGA